MDVPNDLVYNFLVELKKKDVDPIDRAKIIRKYAENQGLSIRALAEELGMSHSTLQDWVDYERVDHKEFNKLLSDGYTKKNVYRILRDTRGDKKQFESIVKVELNVVLKNAYLEIRPFINNPVYDEYTAEILHDLINTLNHLDMRIEKRIKNGDKRR